MKKFLQKRKRKGFTLVELLIVIIIIGILAGSMLLVMGAGRDKAEATKIVSNLRSLKAAAVMYYSDHNAWPSQASDFDNYMDGSVTGIQVTSADSGATYWIGTSIDHAGADSGVAAKLVLMQADGIPLYSSAASASEYTSAAENVWMQVK